MPKTKIKTEIPYEMNDGGILTTPCPYMESIQLEVFRNGSKKIEKIGNPILPMVGSVMCADCTHHVDHLRAERIVICSHPITD